MEIEDRVERMVEVRKIVEERNLHSLVLPLFQKMMTHAVKSKQTLEGQILLLISSSLPKSHMSHMVVSNPDEIPNLYPWR